MERVQIRPLNRDDGVHALVDGLGPRFRFRIGSGSVSALDYEAAHIWVVDGAVGRYSLQFVPQRLAPAPRPEAIEILVSHFHWETGFLRERLGVEVDERSFGSLKHPAGTPVLTWISRNPESMSRADPTASGRSDEAAQPSPGSGMGNATPFSAQATLLHFPDDLLHFAVTGFDSPWTEDDLRSQVLRATLSYFPVDGK